MKTPCGECEGGRREVAEWRGEYVAAVRVECETCDGTGEMYLCSRCGAEIAPRHVADYDEVRELCGVCSDEAEEAERKAAEAARPSDSAALAGATAALIGQCLGAIAGAR